MKIERKDDSGAGGNIDVAQALVEIKKATENIGRDFELYKQTNDALIKAKADGKAIGDFEGKLALIEKSIGTLTDYKSALDDLVAKVDRMDMSGADDPKAKAELETEVKDFNSARRTYRVVGADVSDARADDYTLYKGAYFKFMRRGNVDVLNDGERKAMQVGVDSDGGYVMPPPTVGRINKKVFDLSPMRSLAASMSVSGDSLEGINDLDEASYGWVGETSTRSETNTPTVGRYRLEVHEMYALPKVTQKLLDDAAVDIEAWLAEKVADRFARAESDAFINGTGVGQPRGFTTYTTAATGDSSRTWGQLEHVVTGANGAFHTTQADPLFDLIQAFKPQYLQNAKWLVRRETIAAIRKFKTSTTSEYIWQPGLQVGQPDRLLGYPLVNCQDLPAHTTTGALSMWLGDWSQAYQIVDRLGIRTQRDPFTARPYILFYVTRRVGGGVLNFEAAKALKFST